MSKQDEYQLYLQKEASWYLKDEAITQAKVDFDEFGYWQDRYPNNRFLREIYETAFAEAYAQAQIDDAIWSDPDA